MLGRFPDLPFLKNALAVDFGDSGPDAYRRAFHRLICGLEHKEPGADGTFRGNLRFPEPARGKTPVDDRAGDGFPAQVMRSLDMRLPLMILAPADAHTSLQVDALRREAEARWGTDNVFTLFPPTSTRADSAAYFARLGMQTRLEEKVAESWEWAGALERRLREGRELFLLVTGFDNGPEDLRRVFAAGLRGLQENYAGRLHLVTMGGKRLAALKQSSTPMHKSPPIG